MAYMLAANMVSDALAASYTHDTDIRRVGSTLMVNPGECGGWLRGRATVVVLDLETMVSQLLEL